MGNHHITPYHNAATDISARASAHSTPSRYQSDPIKGPAQAEPGKQTSGANESQLPHVTEEQAAMDEIMGETPPQTDDQSTPVAEILQRDQDAQKNAPEVFKKGMKKPGEGQQRSFSTSARRLEAELQSASGAGDALPESMLVAKVKNAAAKFDDTRAVGLDYPDAGPGHKFPLPDMEKWKVTDHMRRRYDPVIDQFTKMIMRDGKLARAQKNMDHILSTLRTAPPPAMNSARPLLSDASINTTHTTAPAVPRANLSMSPIQYLTSVVDSVAPLVKIRQQRGVLGGGQSLPIPVPLRIKQRRRTAIKWIIEGSEKRTDVSLKERVAREIMAVASGSSGVWEKRAGVHRLAITARSNVRSNTARGRRR